MYKKFEDWFHEVQSFSLRSEYFYDDFKDVDTDKIIKWLKVCWDVAREDESTCIDFLHQKIKYFLDNGVQVTSGEYSEKNNKCKHGNYGYEGCQTCAEEYFSNVLKNFEELLK